MKDERRDSAGTAEQHLRASKFPLYDFEAEAAVLGALLFNNRLVDNIRANLSPAHFYEPAHARIYERILRLVDQDDWANPLTLRRHFEADEALKPLGGIGYLARLSENVEGLFSVGELSKQIRELAQRRWLIECAGSMIEAAHDISTPLANVPFPDFAEFAIPTSGLPVIDIAKWQGDPPPREFAWGDWVPMRQTTMLTGKGGVGKSLLAQMLTTCVALGRPFLGLETRQMNALYITSEDDEDELRRRQTAICAALKVPLTDIFDKLYLVSLAGRQETALAFVDAEHEFRTTEVWREVQATVTAHDIRFVAFDNATDMMAGDHNDVHQVAAFANLLTGLAIEIDGVSLILHHPNKGGDDWLGSVAWHNKVRSRLIMKQGGDPDHDCRTIENPKANYGPSHGKIEFRWYRDSFIRDDELPADKRTELTELAVANGEIAAFLNCLRERAIQGEARDVGPRPGPNYAPTQFEGTPQAKGFKKEALKRAMDRLLTIGRIEIVKVENKKANRDAYVIREVPESLHNALHNARTTPPHNDAQPAAQTSTTQTLDTTYLSGAAHEAAP
jgi:hypothetical protein